MSTVFPRLTALSRVDQKGGEGQRANDGEAVCQFYPELQADTVCDECGCFMSQKAAVTWSGRNLCLPCLHQLREAKSSDAFAAKRTLHDNVGLGLVVFLLPLTLITGPIALFYLIRHRKAPGSLVPRSRLRWRLALSLAAATTVGWIFLFIVWISMIVRAITN